MNGREDLPGDVRDLLDAYCSGLIDDAGVARLEDILRQDARARREFVEYFHLHTELQFAIRARRATAEVLEQVADGPRDEPRAGRGPHPGARRWALAAGVLVAAGLALGGWSWMSGRRPQPGNGPAAARSSNVAWLVNAQDCQWAGNASQMPGRDMRAGKVLQLRRGLAEVEFDHGARLILQGPAGLELLSSNAVRLIHGTLTARVPPLARGFTVYSPQGKVVDLGTEFGLTVDERGTTAVRVFAGEVVAAPLAGGEQVASGVTLHADQSARIDGRTVAVRPRGDRDDARRYVRAIVPPPVVTPRSRTLDFAAPAAGTLRDASGRGTGLTHRLPGTGGAMPAQDENLRLVPGRGVLELTTTRSDINTQQGMPTGEYLGFRLSDLGFSGSEDFAIAATIPNIPGLETVGQFGLYAGSSSDENIRGGLISQRWPDQYGLFLVNNDGGRDSDLYEVGLIGTGDDLRLTLRRVAGKYSLVVENQTTHSSSTLAIAHPAFLDGERDLYVGLFGANTQSDVRKTLTIRQVSVTVWSVAPAKGPAAGATPGRAAD
jgi:ferric-dicitrate binding protein FerR (iron transport regulator)